MIIVNFSQFKINPNLVITFIIPPLNFEAMMKVDYKQFKAIRISALLLATLTNAYVLSPLNLNKETSFAEVEHMIYDIIKSSPSIDDVHGIGEIIRTSNQSIMHGGGSRAQATSRARFFPWAGRNATARSPAHRLAQAPRWCARRLRCASFRSRGRPSSAR